MMGVPRYDIDEVINDIISFLKLKLNPAITAFNAKKADGISLKLIPDDGFIRSLNEQAANFDPFVGVSWTVEGGDANGPFMAERYTVEVIIAFANTNNDIDTDEIFKARYFWVLRKLFEDNWRDILRISDMTIQPATPVTLSLFDDSQLYHVVGRILEVTLG